MGSCSPRPAFMVSAPGKVIVYGEHAVVYGKAAIAAAISLRSYLLVTFLAKANRTITLCSPDIGLDYTWNIDDLPWDAVTRNRTDQACEFITALDPNLVEDLQPHIKSVSPDLADHTRKTHQSAAFAFLYLLLSLGSQHGSDPCIYAVRSTIPVGAGLGSSASLAVCISTALLLQAGALETPPHAGQPSRGMEAPIKRVNKWAFVAELCIHGNPSGVDNTVCSGGKAVLYRKKDPAQPPAVVPLPRFPELPLLLVDTRSPRDAGREIARVRGLRAEHPLVVAGVLDAIGAAADAAHALVAAPGFDPASAAARRRLGALVAVNHALLAALGVSHPRLERARALVERLGVGWTKLTGAGGGGCAIVVPEPGVEIHQPPLPNRRRRPSAADVPDGLAEAPEPPRPSSSAQKMADLHRMLADEGMVAFTTTLAGDGVGVLWPAVLHGASGDEGGAGADHERFVRLEGKEAIESFVGLSNGEAMVRCRGGWRFWRR